MITGSLLEISFFFHNSLTKLKTMMGDRTFSVAAARACNSFFVIYDVSAVADSVQEPIEDSPAPIVSVKYL